jgi:hypothetical protein
MEVRGKCINFQNGPLSEDLEINNEINGADVIAKCAQNISDLYKKLEEIEKMKNEEIN